MEEGTTAHDLGGKWRSLHTEKDATWESGRLIDSSAPHRPCRLPGPRAYLFVGEGVNSRMEVVHKDDTLVAGHHEHPAARLEPDQRR